ATARLAALLDAAGDAGLGVELEVPVLAGTHAGLAETVRRALNRAPRVSAIHLAFGASARSGLPGPWDFRDAATAVADAIAAASARGVPVRLASPAPPPCLVDVAGLGAPIPPERDTPRPFEACGACALAGACGGESAHFAPAPGRPVLPVVRDAAERGPAGPAQVLLRRRDLATLLDRLAAAPRLACTSPWTVLAAHNPRGSVAPCRGSLLREEVHSATGNWQREPLLDVWNSPGMRAVRRAIAADRASDACRPECPVFFGAAHSGDLAPSVPSGRVAYENLRLQVEEVLERADVLRSRPSCLVVSPSLHCNNRCRMCPVHVEAGPFGDMPDAVFRSVLDLLPTLRDLSFAGAEPLMSSRFAELVRACDADRHPDLGLALTTNGLLLEPALLRDMGRARFHTIIVSVNAATVATHERVSGRPGGFDRVLANVAALVSASREWRGRPRVLLSFVLMRSNVNEIGGFMDLAARMGVGFRLLPVERDQGGESVFTDEEALRAALRAVRDDAMPRAAGLPAPLAAEVTVLEARLRARLDAGVFEAL
ncbi:MAG: radical SAM protein, partial [Deltaproteobacteria bacterium]|nr:radical SAM protein [Deltaproteobacteria bacterium]